MESNMFHINVYSVMIQSALQEARALGSLASVSALSRLDIGENIFDYDWDLLIVLDACRIDALHSVAPDFDFIQKNRIKSKWSVGSTSKEWINRTFNKQHLDIIQDTCHISANGFAYDIRADDREQEYVEFDGTFVEQFTTIQQLLPDGLVAEEELGQLVGLWGDPDRSQDAENERLPKSVTDHAIWVGRNTDYDRTVVHYMQPHAPFYTSGRRYEDLEEHEKNPFGALKSGTNFDIVWSSYLKNLRFVLKHVETLLNNFEAETVVLTADHGELFGEWGLYSHHAGIPHPRLRKVPWIKIESSDMSAYSPDIDKNSVLEEKAGRISEDSLEALGYL